MTKRWNLSDRAGRESILLMRCDAMYMYMFVKRFEKEMYFLNLLKYELEKVINLDVDYLF